MAIQNLMNLTKQENKSQDEEGAKSKMSIDELAKQAVAENRMVSVEEG